MDVITAIRLLRQRRALAARDHWTRDLLVAHQQSELERLRRFAVANSPFYQSLHRGLDDAPLADLPIVSKQTLMEQFDDVVTDRGVHLRDVERHLETTTPSGRFRGRYRVALTGGTTGRRGIFLSGPSEWTTVLASYTRANDWAGIAAGIGRRLRVAVVSSRVATHQSSIVGATVANPFVPTLRLDATAPMADITGELDRFRPDSLVGYASILGELAEEQLKGRLAIRPRAVMSASEVLTPHIRGRIRGAFGVEAFNVYAATETAGIASECTLHHLHLYEDLVIAEIVDRDGNAVPAGTTGDRLLVTVLFSRTQPLIRYELSDRVTASAEMCSDGRPFALISAIEGRDEETLVVGGVRVHPNVFHAALDPIELGAWQVVQRDGKLEILIVQPGPGITVDAVARRVEGELRDAQADLDQVTARVVEEIPRTALGKQPLIVRASGPSRPH